MKIVIPGGTGQIGSMLARAFLARGDDVVIVPSLQDPELIKQKFPKGYKALKPYLRMTPQPNR
jgi:nucleoside-diphosphate-sugar epimerase